MTLCYHSTQNSLSFRLLAKNVKLKYTHLNVCLLFYMGVRIVSYITGRTWVEYVREWGPEEYIWVYEGRSKSRLKKNT